MRDDLPIDDSAVVEEVFGFLDFKKDTGNKAHAPSAFRDLSASVVSIGSESLKLIEKPYDPDCLSGITEWRNYHWNPNFTEGLRGLIRIQVPKICYHLFPRECYTPVFQEAPQTSFTAFAVTG